VIIGGVAEIINEKEEGTLVFSPTLLKRRLRTDIMELVSVGNAARGVAAITIHSDAGRLRTLAITAGVCWSVLFVIIGLRYELQMYADGSIFAYAVAVQDAWAFHWHNIIGRLFVYVFSYVPAEIYLELTRDASGAVVVHGFLFFVAPLLALIATWAADKSKGRIIFGGACLSTACLCPLVFGFPTETWMAHSLFWPTLAVCHYTRPGLGGITLVFVMMLALVFTHEGALLFALAIVATLLLRDARDAAFWRAAGAFLLISSIWVMARVAFPPDDYIADTLRTAALHVFDPSILGSGLILLLLGALAGYGIAFFGLRRLAPQSAHMHAAWIVAVTLAVYWLWFGHALHAENRYYLRTVLLIVTPLLGIVAAVRALDAEGRLSLSFLSRSVAASTSDVMGRMAFGAILLVMLVHAVETTKFVAAWTNYHAAVRALATGTTSDPTLGDLRFVSSQRISPDLNRLAWSSTTHFLSVLVAPGFAPTRLVVDPNENYFWLSCETATANREAERVVPTNSRELVRVHACMHR
jgi:hypothetical protein